MGLTLDKLIEQVFDESDLGRVADSVRSGRANAALERLDEAWAAWADDWQPPNLPVGHLRPYAYNQWMNAESSSLGSTWVRLVGQLDDSELLERQIVRHLLFCDSVAVPDPFYVAPDGEITRSRVAGLDPAAARIRTAAAIDAIDRLRPLISENILVVVPRQTLATVETLNALPQIDPETAALFRAPPPNWYGLSDAEISAIDLAIQLSSAEGKLDPYLPTAGDLAVFRQLSKAADRSLHETFGTRSPDPKNALLPRVLSCSLPDPMRVSIADVVAIRRDGHFQDWRDAVAIGVRKCATEIGDDPDEWLNSDDAVRQAISVEVTDMAEEAKKSLGWIKNKKVDVAFNLVLVGGATAAAVLAPPVAIALGTVPAVKTLAGSFHRWQFARGSVPRHVAAFSGAASP